MPYKGHVENGAIVLDEPANLNEGDKVEVELVESAGSASSRTPLRGTKYEFSAPFSPATTEEDWDAVR